MPKFEDAIGSHYTAPLAAEFWGTLALTFTVICNIASASGLFAVTSVAFVYMIFVYAFMPISGAHFNPAVTLALGAAGKIEGGSSQIINYIAVQCFAAIIAGLMGAVAFQDTIIHLTPGVGSTGMQAFGVEFLYCCMLCFVILCVSATKSTAGNQYYGLAIGGVLLAGGYGAGKISAGAFNPAVCLAMEMCHFFREHVLVHESSPEDATAPGSWAGNYAFAHLFAAIVASLLYKRVHPEEYEEAPATPPAEGEAPKVSEKARLISEFIGTFFLVTTIGLGIAVSSSGTAWSAAACLMCMIYALGSVSGGHFNPAVTIAVRLSERNQIATGLAMKYIIVQLVAGTCAGALVPDYVGDQRSVPSVKPGIGFNVAHALIVELVFTTALCFTVLCVATTKISKSEDNFGWIIGMCVVLGGVASGAVSGGYLNAAVALGMNVAHFFAPINAIKWQYFAGYAAVQFVAGGAAAGLLRLCFPSEYGKADADLVRGFLTADIAPSQEPLLAGGDDAPADAPADDLVPADAPAQATI